MIDPPPRPVLCAAAPPDRLGLDPGRTVTGDDGVIRRFARIHQLVVVYAPERVDVRIRLLDQAPVAIGREPGDGLRLPDPEASRRHAVVARDPAREVWTITDLGSRNGMFVDGVPRRDAELADGTVIRIGGSLLVFVAIDVPPGALLEPQDEHLLGGSARMQLVRGELALVAPRTLPVLLCGPSGTGKECAARSIHARSRRPGPLVTVNCAAIAPSLAESELFGHIAGAFTGATSRREGLFAAADRGTLLLDEIGDLALELQAKLLRALALGEVRPVGDSGTTTVDVRIVAATLVDLGRAVEAGRFRGDLYARLAGWTVQLPPLSARRDDILPLATAWLGRRSTARLSPGAAEALLVHSWPYNVRQLQHALDVAVARAADGVIRVEHLPAEIGATLCERAAARDPSAASEAPVPLALVVDRTAAWPAAHLLGAVVEDIGGAVARAPRVIGRERKPVYRWLKRHGLDPERFRDPADP